MTTLCPTCHLPEKPIGHMFPELCVVALHDAIIRLLDQIADKGTCTGCGATVYWVRHKNGKRVPYTTAGLNHFVDCKKADQFRKKAS